MTILEILEHVLRSVLLRNDRRSFSAVWRKDITGAPRRRWPIERFQESVFSNPGPKGFTDFCGTSSRILDPICIVEKYQRLCIYGLTPHRNIFLPGLNAGRRLIGGGFV